MSNVKLVRVIPALLAALLLPLLAGCGSTGAAGSAASAVPEDVAVYVSVDTSFEGGQWRAVSDLLAKFPDGEGALEELLDKAAAGAGLSGGDGLKDALGPEVAIAVLDVPQGPGQAAPVVLLTQPDDEDAFRKLVEEGEAAFGEVNGWQVVADDEATLERYRDSLDGPSLEGSAQFEETMDDLDDDALVHAYVNGGALVRALASQPGLPAGALGMLTGQEVGSIGATLKAEGDGVRLEGRVVAPAQAEQGAAAEPYGAELPEEVPGDVLAYVSFNDLGGMLTGAGGAGLMMLGVDPAAIGELFSGESALYVRAGTAQPAVTLVTRVEDEAAALRTVEGLLGLAGARKGQIAYDAFDGLLVVSTSRAEIAALRGDGPRLDQDDGFEQALESAGLPDETTGFGYVDLQAAIPLVLGLATTPGVQIPDVHEYLEPLSSVVFWGSRSGSVQRFSLFVGIE